MTSQSDCGQMNNLQNVSACWGLFLDHGNIHQELRKESYVQHHDLNNSVYNYFEQSNDPLFKIEYGSRGFESAGNDEIEG